jgi:predicted alpha/beta-fold hydrolase
VLGGHLARAGARGTLVVIVHGLGGCSESPYVIRLAAECQRQGLASLRLDLRGADRSGADLYHAGLSADLHAVVERALRQGHERLLLAGFSMGGHLVLRAASEGLPATVRAVAAVCPPLDLAAAQQHLDRPARALYRRSVLMSLKAMYRAFCRLGAHPLPWREARRLTTFLEWDDRIVAPYFGFQSAQDYYRRASVTGHLEWIHTPALIVHARHDPMIPWRALEPVIGGTVTHRTVTRGGHVGFPADVDLGIGGARGLETRLVAWLAEH